MRSAPRTAVIVIDNFNYARYLGAAIDSALKQTWPNCRVLIVDDGSIDDSRSVVARREHRATAIFKEHGGQASAVNAGFAASEGDVYFFLDADDLLGSNTVTSVMRAFARHPAAARVQFPLRLVDAAGNTLPGTLPKRIDHMPNGNIVNQLLAYNDDLAWSPMSGNAYPAHVLDEILPIPEADYPEIGADLYLLNLAPLFGPVVSLPSPGGSYRVHDRNGDFRWSVDLDRSRRIVQLSEITHGHIQSRARELGMDNCRIETIGRDSLTLFGHRLTLARLDSPGDGVPASWAIAKAGIAAAFRRTDIPLARKVLFCGWLMALAIAPTGAVRRLAQIPFGRQPMKNDSKAE
jgi:hypothetical protein